MASNGMARQWPQEKNMCRRERNERCGKCKTTKNWSYFKLLSAAPFVCRLRAQVEHKFSIRIVFVATSIVRLRVVYGKPCLKYKYNRADASSAAPAACIDLGKSNFRFSVLWRPYCHEVCPCESSRDSSARAPLTGVWLHASQIENGVRVKSCVIKFDK